MAESVTKLPAELHTALSYLPDDVHRAVVAVVSSLTVMPDDQRVRMCHMLLDMTEGKDYRRWFAVAAR